MSESPQLIVIAGPNGAGKSTLAPHLLRDALGIDEFVNADKIAEGLSGYSPERVAVEAGKIMLDRVQTLIESQHDFAIETTLSGRHWLKRFRIAKNAFDYHISINYLWIAHPEICVSRVKERQKHGAHDIPEETIRRRYQRSLDNFLEEYCHLADEWSMINNTSKSEATLIAEKNSLDQVSIHSQGVWDSLNPNDIND